MSIEKAAKVASEWWANVVCNPKFDNGDDRQEGKLASAMAKMNVNLINQETKEKFQKTLEEKIISILKVREYMELNCDYGPDINLMEVAKVCGINPLNFPWKTNMGISPDFVNVSYGYATPYEFIYATKKHLEKQMSDQEGRIQVLKDDLDKSVLQLSQCVDGEYLFQEQTENDVAPEEVETVDNQTQSE